MNNPIARAQIEKGLSCLEGDDKKRFLHQALRKDLTEEARTYVEGFFLGEDRMELSRDYDKNTMSLRGRVAAEFVKNGRVGEIIGNLVRYEEVPQLDKQTIDALHEFYMKKAIETTRKSYNSNGSFFERSEESIDQVARIRGCSEEEARDEIGRHFELNGELDLAYRQYTNNYDHLSEARIELKMGKKSQAAINLRLGGDYKRAAQLYEEMGDLDNACECWLELGDNERVKFLAKQGDLPQRLADAWESENKWVAKAIRERKAKKGARNLVERIKAHGTGLENVDEMVDFLERALEKRYLKPETKNIVREMLDEKYHEVEETYGTEWRADSGCLPSDPLDPRKAREALRKLEELWVGTDRYDKLAQYEKNPEKKVDFYLKAGMRSQAVNLLRRIADDHIDNLQAEKAAEVRGRIKNINL